MAFCTECGTNVPGDVKFCTSCGSPMKPSDFAASEPPPAAPEPPAYQPSQQPRQAPPPNYPPPNYPPPIQPTVQQAYYPPLPQPSVAGDVPPPSDSPYAPIGAGGFIGMMILFAIPIIGFIACVIMAFTAKNKNRRGFAKAMFILAIIGIILSIIMYFVFSWMFQTFMAYVNEAAGGALNDYNSLTDLFGLLDGY